MNRDRIALWGLVLVLFALTWANNKQAHIIEVQQQVIRILAQDLHLGLEEPRP